MPRARYNSPYWISMRAAERKIIQYYLETTDTVAAAARLMGMDKGWLYGRMRKLEIPTPVRNHPGKGNKTTKKAPESGAEVTQSTPEPSTLEDIQPAQNNVTPFTREPPEDPVWDEEPDPEDEDDPEDDEDDEDDDDLEDDDDAEDEDPYYAG